MKQVVLLYMLLLLSNYTFSQTTEKVIRKDSGEEIEVSNFPTISVATSTFYFNSNSVQCVNIDLLKEMTAILANNTIKRIILESHCSDEEFKTYPTISLKRATEIKNLMKGFGYDPNSIEIKDMKNNQPVDWTGNHKENQRVELIILKA